MAAQDTAAGTAGSGAATEPGNGTVTDARLAAETEIKAMIARLRDLARAGYSQEAEDFARATIARAKELFGPKDGYVGVTSANLGRLLRHAGRPAEAAPFLVTALEIASKYFGFGDKGYKDAVAELSDALLAAKSPEAAVRLYERLIAAAAAKPATVLHEAHYRSELGLVLRRAGRFAESEAQFNKTLAIRQSALPEDHTDIGRTMTDLAGVLRMTGRFVEAEQLYLEVIAGKRRLGEQDSANIGILLDNLGVVYNELGRYADAERVQRQALAIFEAKLGRDHLTTTQGAANLAALYYAQGRAQDALPLFERAREVYRRTLPPEDPRLGFLLDNLGGVYRNLRRYEDARTVMREALASLTATYPETHPEVSTALSNLAGGESDLGNDAEAEQLYLRAVKSLAAHPSGDKSHRMATVLMGLSDIRGRQGRIAEAQEGYRRAVEIVEATLGADHPTLVRPLRLLAGQALGFRKYDEALALSRRALQVELTSRSRRRLDRGEQATANDSAGPFFGALDVSWRVNDAALPGDTSLDAEAFETAQWITLSSAGRSLAQLGVRMSASNPELSVLVRERQDLARDWSAADAKLVRSVGLSADRRDPAAESAFRAALTTIEARVAAIDQRLAVDFAAFAALSQPKPLTLAETRALLGPDEVLLQFVTAPNHTYLWAISREQVIWRRINVAEVELAKRISTLRCGLDPSRWVGEAALKCLERVGRAPDGEMLPFDATAAHALYRDLLGPIADQLGQRTLLIVTTGVLTSLPFQLMLKEPVASLDMAGMATAPWLLKSNAVVTLPAVSSLGTLRRQAGASRATRPYLGIANPLLVGPEGTDRRADERLQCPGPSSRPLHLAMAATPTASLQSVVRGGNIDADSVRSLAPLPETTDEVCSVGQRLGARSDRDLLLGPAASRARLLAANADRSLADYRVIHFATHGLVSGELSGLVEPALVLTPPAQPGGDNGLLTASDVATLQLDAEIVVLSACNTAAGEGQDGQALSGLARAFFFAGSRSMIVSHWPVNSDAAVALITATFESQAVLPGVGKAKALQSAMIKMLSDPSRPDFAHPQMWAPFVLVGETTAPGLTSSISTASTTPAAAPLDVAPAEALPASPPAAIKAVTRSKSDATRGTGNRQRAKAKVEKEAPYDPQSVFREPK